jgi:hypothetical protein
MCFAGPRARRAGDGVAGMILRPVALALLLGVLLTGCAACRQREGLGQ